MRTVLLFAQPNTVIVAELSATRNDGKKNSLRFWREIGKLGAEVKKGKGERRKRRKLHNPGCNWQLPYSGVYSPFCLFFLCFGFEVEVDQFEFEAKLQRKAYTGYVILDLLCVKLDTGKPKHQQNQQKGNNNRSIEVKRDKRSRNTGSKW